jgi:predicted transcriptional regulator
MADLKTKACRCCGGNGRELDHRAVGKEMRRRRIQAGISQTAMAKRMKVTGAYVCDLEVGSRNWRQELVDRYMKALKP